MSLYIEVLVLVMRGPSVDTCLTSSAHRPSLSLNSSVFGDFYASLLWSDHSIVMTAAAAAVEYCLGFLCLLLILDICFNC